MAVLIANINAKKAVIIALMENVKSVKIILDGILTK